jgi:membrane-bound metal-dependent hydrolase YbcI (DUF457 family)
LSREKNVKKDSHIFRYSFRFSKWLINISNPFNTCINFLIIAISSTLPDIDIKLNIPHRRFTHSLLFGIILSILIFYIYPSALPPFWLGFYLHLVADVLTNTGVQLFFPIKEKISIHLMNTMDSIEYIIQTCCFLVTVIMLYRQIISG